jgi:molybdopterin biosynthesis enzyme
METAEENFLDAAVKVVAEKIAVPCDMPSFNNSAMDNYAVISDDSRQP